MSKTARVLTVQPEQPKRKRARYDSEKKRKRLSVDMPPDVHAKLKGVASLRKVPLHEVAQLFLRYALAAYQRGDLEFTARHSDEMHIDFSEFRP